MSLDTYLLPFFSTFYCPLCFTFFVYTCVLWKLAIIQIARRKRRRKVELILGEPVIGKERNVNTFTRHFYTRVRISVGMIYNKKCSKCSSIQR